MKKYIFITNGSGGCGKDTFAIFLSEVVPTFKYSSIDKIKSIAGYCGWKGQKREKDRKFLSDLKVLTSDYNDMPFREIQERVERFKVDHKHVVMLIDIREPEEIERAKKEFGAQTILIKRDSVPQITSNMADANVDNYEYDFVLENNGTLEEFRNKIVEFADENLEYDFFDDVEKALWHIETQLSEEYLDISWPDTIEIAIVKDAIRLYKNELEKEKNDNETETEVK